MEAHLTDDEQRIPNKRIKDISISSYQSILMLPYHEPLLLSLRVMPFVDSSSVCRELMKEGCWIQDNRMM